VQRAAENGADADMQARVQAKQGQLDPPTAQEVKLAIGVSLLCHECSGPVSLLQVCEFGVYVMSLHSRRF